MTRELRFTNADGVEVTRNVTKADFSLDPVSDRYGALILNDGTGDVGYVNLRTFIISDAARQLRDAFELFRNNGVDRVILDLRYNGGGLVSVAETLGDLLGDGLGGQVFSNTEFNQARSNNNTTRRV